MHQALSKIPYSIAKCDVRVEFPFISWCWYASWMTAVSYRTAYCRRIRRARVGHWVGGVLQRRQQQQCEYVQQLLSIQHSQWGMMSFLGHPACCLAANHCCKCCCVSCMYLYSTRRFDINTTLLWTRCARIPLAYVGCVATMFTNYL